MQASTPLTPRTAAAFGSAFILSGLWPILVGLGAVKVRLPPGIQPWVVAVAGAMFIFAGLSIVNSYAFGGGATVLRYLLHLATIGSMFTVFAWIAVGPGERHFNTWLSFPAGRLRGNDSERFGRIAFGICAGFLAILFLSVCASAVKRLRGAVARDLAS